MGDAPLWHADHSLSFFSLYQILLCKKDTDFAEFIMIEYSFSQRPLPYSASGDLQATVCTASTGISFLPQSFTIAFNVIKGQRLHIEYIRSYNILKARKCFSLMYWEGRVKRLVCVWADRKNTEDKHSYHSPASLTHRLNVFTHPALNLLCHRRWPWASDLPVHPLRLPQIQRASLIGLQSPGKQKVAVLGARALESWLSYNKAISVSLLQPNCCPQNPGGFLKISDMCGFWESGPVPATISSSNLKEEGFNLASGSEVLPHGQLAPLFWGCGKAEHHGRGAWQGRAKLLTPQWPESRAQIKRGRREKKEDRGKRREDKGRGHSLGSVLWSSNTFSTSQTCWAVRETRFYHTACGGQAHILVPHACRFIP